MTSDLRPNFGLDFLRSNWVSFDPTQLKHNGGNIDVLDLIGR